MTIPMPKKLCCAECALLKLDPTAPHYPNGACRPKGLAAVVSLDGEVCRAFEEAEEDHFLPMITALLYKTLGERDLTPEDFPDRGKPLPPEYQRILIERALSLKKVTMAHLMAVPLGFPWDPKGGRLEWALRRWLRSWRGNEGRLREAERG